MWGIRRLVWAGYSHFGERQEWNQCVGPHLAGSVNARLSGELSRAPA